VREWVLGYSCGVDPGAAFDLLAEDDGSTARLHEASKTMAECDRKLAKYRAALESGTDPAIVAEQQLIRLADHPSL
jgi:hypothetical protein